MIKRMGRKIIGKREKKRMEKERKRDKEKKDRGKISCRKLIMERDKTACNTHIIYFLPASNMILRNNYYD